MPSADVTAGIEVLQSATPKKADRPSPFSSVICPQCGGYHTTRSHRRSFIEREILYRLGYFPWKCIDCANRFFDKERGRGLRGAAR
jgi:hypothetical protein